jgi:hypothetical protein
VHDELHILTIDPAVIWTGEVVCCTASFGHGGSVVTADIMKGTQLASLIPAHVSRTQPADTAPHSCRRATHGCQEQA